MKIRLACLALFVIAAAVPGGTARADVLSSCDAYDSLITCAAADVGKACQGGGQCYAVTCGTGANATTTTQVYKCDTCPPVLAAPDAGCSPNNAGGACGDGGSCAYLQPYCGASAKYACAGHPGAEPTGPPAGEAADGGAKTDGGANRDGGVCDCGSKGGGCDVAPPVKVPGAIALALLAVGGFALLAARRRRRARKP